MKAVKKFTSFEDLKSCDGKKVSEELRLKKHNNFEKAIRDIKSDNARKSNYSKSK